MKKYNTRMAYAGTIGFTQSFLNSLSKTGLNEFQLGLVKLAQEKIEKDWVELQESIKINNLWERQTTNKRHTSLKK